MSVTFIPFFQNTLTVSLSYFFQEQHVIQFSYIGATLSEVSIHFIYTNNTLCINNKESNKNVLFSAMTPNILVGSSSMKTSQHIKDICIYLNYK